MSKSQKKSTKSSDSKESKRNSNVRIIDSVFRMLAGETLTKDGVVKRFKVSKRTAERDFTNINRSKIFKERYRLFHEAGTEEYSIVEKENQIDPEIVVALLKSLIGSHALNKEEMKTVVEQLFRFLTPKDESNINKLVSTTLNNYSNDKTVEILPRIKDFTSCIIARKQISFIYNSSISTSNHMKRHIGVPLNMYFANNHFYVMMYLIEHEKTLSYRLDRFEEYSSSKKSFDVPANKRPNESKVIDSTYLLNGGNLIHYKFSYEGNERITLDSVPNSRLSPDNDPRDRNHTIVEGDLYEQGAIMWVLGHGTQVKVLAPRSLKVKVVERLRETLSLYSD